MADSPAPPAAGAALEAGRTLSHYRLTEKIGAGGMGVVWKATDTTLGRDVAIKVLPPDLALDAARRKMFTDEAKLASRLTDAHIAQVHELGHEDGTDFIVMEYVDGKPLDKYIEGQSLTPEKVAELGGQVARALSRAHRKGLIHRDLKPGNILVTEEGEAKVVDFGLATLFERADETMLTQAPTQSMSEAPTEVGEPKSLMGTIPYMSPEQVRLEKLDGRSDIFSLGSVLYEMTTGQLPFVAPTAGELMQEVRKARPTPVRELEPSMPPELETIVSKAMAAKKEERYQHAEDLAVDLKRLNRQLETGTLPSQVGVEVEPVWRRPWAVAAAVATFVALAAVAVFVGRGMMFPPPDPGTLLIAPLTVQGEEQGAEYLGRWFAEILAAEMAVRAQEIRVLPVPTAAELAGAAVGAQTAVERGAGRLMTGTLIRDGEVVHASLSLVDSAADRVLWGSSRETARADLKYVPPELARDVASELGAVPRKLYDWSGSLTENPTLARSAVYLEVLVANRQWKTLPALTIESLVSAFPEEPDALVLALDAFSNRGLFAKDEEGWKRAEETIADLMRLDPDAPWETIYRSWRERDLELFDAVLARDDLTPSLRAVVLGERAFTVGNQGDHAAMLRDYAEASRLNHPDWGAYRNYSNALWKDGRLEEALEQSRRAMAINPSARDVRANLARRLAQTERWEEAIPLLENNCETRLWGGQEQCAWQAYALHQVGREAEAFAVAEEAATLEDTRPGRFMLARYHAISGDRVAAVENLRRYLELGDVPGDLGWMRDGADLSVLNGDPEFEALILQEAREALSRYGGEDSGVEPNQLNTASAAVILHIAGREAEALDAASASAGLEETSGGSLMLAWYHGLAGNREETLHYLGRRVELGSPRPERRWSDLRPFTWLRGDPEFDALAARLRGHDPEEPEQ